MEPLEKEDILIKNFIKDTPRYIECWMFEDKHGNNYTICQDQNGHEWLE